jgi:Recombination endonuclease VII
MSRRHPDWTTISCAYCGKEIVRKRKDKQFCSDNCRAKNRLSKPEVIALVKIQQRKRNLKAFYGITVEDYEKILKLQGGVCAICGGVNENSRQLAVDHNHKTGDIRGLLCHLCNGLLGHARDRKDILKKAIRYLNINEKNV